MNNYLEKVLVGAMVTTTDSSNSGRRFVCLYIVGVFIRDFIVLGAVEYEVLINLSLKSYIIFLMLMLHVPLIGYLLTMLICTLFFMFLTDEKNS